MSTLPAAEVPLWAPLYGASPVDAVRRFFKKYATFSGRASRSEYWWFALANVVVYIVLYVGLLLLAAGIGAAAQAGSGSLPAWTVGFSFLPLVASFLWFAGTIVPNVALTVRRFHDANFSGLLVLLGLVPYVGALITFIMSVMPSNALGRRFDAPNGVPVWASGMPYQAFPPAPGEPDRYLPPMPGAYTAPGAYPPPHEAGTTYPPPYAPPQNGDPYGPPPVAPPSAVTPPPRPKDDWTPPTSS